MILNINKYLLICKCAINKRAATNKAWDVRGPASLSQHQNKPGIIVKLRVSSLLIFLDIQILTLLQKVTLSKTYVHIIVQFAKNGEFIKISYIIWLLERWKTVCPVLTLVKFLNLRMDPRTLYLVGFP